MDTNPTPETTTDDKPSRKIDVEKLKSGAKKFALAGGLLVAGVALGRATADTTVSVEVTTEDDES